MSDLAWRFRDWRGARARRTAGRSVVGGSGFLMLAAIAFLASFSPFTFLPFMAAAILLALLGAVLAAIPGVLEFFW
jgi:hypothetical protein